MTFSITTLSKMAISVTIKKRDTQHNDIQHYDTQQNGNQRNNKKT
jgi:hypothetical protein